MRLAAIAILICSALQACTRAPSDDREVVRIFCAASAAEMIGGIASRCERQHPSVSIVINAAASSTLAKQIEAGAPCDIVISANTAWMDHLVSHDLVDPDTRVDLFSNTLVLIAHADDTAAAADWLTVPPPAADPPRLAIGDPAHVPAGQYAQQALIAIDSWETWQHRLVPAMDARAALQFVASGQVQLGVVYATDAAGHTGVRVLRAFEPDLHDPIVYPAALHSEHTPAARAVLEHLRSAEAAEMYRGAGFVVLRSQP